jgi:hypothetical protein
MMEDLRLPILLTLAGLSMSPVAARSRPAGWPSAADAQITRDSVTVQATRTMSLDLPGSADAAFPLFGPVDEAKWSPGWSPRFIAPLPGAQSPDGAVFTTGEADSPIVWVMTDFDPAQHIVRYVYVRPEKVAVQLWISVSAVSPQASRAEVTYRYTLLGPGGRDAIQHFIAAFPNFKQHWEEHVGAALTGQAGEHPHP